MRERERLHALEREYYHASASEKRNKKFNPVREKRKQEKNERKRLANEGRNERELRRHYGKLKIFKEFIGLKEIIIYRFIYNNMNGLSILSQFLPTDIIQHVVSEYLVARHVVIQQHIDVLNQLEDIVSRIQDSPKLNISGHIIAGIRFDNRLRQKKKMRSYLRAIFGSNYSIHIK